MLIFQKVQNGVGAICNDLLLLFSIFGCHFGNIQFWRINYNRERHLKNIEFCMFTPTENKSLE